MESRIVFELTRSFFGHPLSPEMVEALRGGVDWARAEELALAHGVGSICEEALGPLCHDLPGLTEAKACFRRQRHINAYRAQRALRDLRELLGALGGQGIHPIVLKGPSLALGLYRDPGLRPMGDLDLLVKEGDESRAMRALAAMGYIAQGEVMTRWEAENLVSHLPVLTARGRMPVEIHFRLFPRAMPLFPDEEGVWERATQGEFAGVRFLRLAAPDELLYLCGHIVRHDSDAHKLIWFCDLALSDRALSDDDRRAFQASVAKAPRPDALLGALRTARVWFGQGDGPGAYDPEGVMASPVTLEDRRIEEALPRLGLLLARMPSWGMRVGFLLSYCFPRLAYIRRYHGTSTEREAWLWRVKRPFWAVSRAFRSVLIRGRRSPRRLMERGSQSNPPR